jgi:Fuc2NAc and GlcNAc transferase
VTVTLARLGAIFVVSLAAALVLTPAAARLAACSGLLDRPNPRSSHTRVTPRGGGLAILAAAALALLTAGGAGPLRLPDAVLLGGVGLLALIGLADDRFGLGPLARMAVQLAVSIALVAVTGGIPRLPLPPPLDLPLGPMAAPLAVIWLVAVTNFFNFLDGIDGLAPAQAAITGLGGALAFWDPFAARVDAALAGGSAGFLAFNWAPARIFLGDVGSLTLGYTLAALPLLAAPDSRSRVVLWTCMSLWLFLSDATWTLMRRAARGERWFEAHREHLYQRLVAGGLGHARVAAAIALGSAVLTALGLLALGTGLAAWAWAALAVAVTLFAVEARLAGRVS